MGTSTGDLPNQQAQEPTVGEPDKLAPPSTPAEAAAPEIAKIEAPAVTPPVPEPQPAPEPVAAVAPATPPEAAPIIVAIEPPKPEVAAADPVMPRPEEIRPAD